MPTVVAIAVVVVLTCIGVLHVHWGLGGTLAVAAAIPEIDGRPAFRPSRAATLMVAVGLFAAAYVIALVGHIVGGPLWRAPRFLAFGLTLRFLARALGDFRLVGFSKRVRSSRFARLDTAFYSPLCLCLALGIGYITYWDV